MDGAWQECSDTMLTIYLSSITKNTAAVSELVEKLNLAHERAIRRRGGPI